MVKNSISYLKLKRLKSCLKVPFFEPKINCLIGMSNMSKKMFIFFSSPYPRFSITLEIESNRPLSKMLTQPCNCNT